MPEACAPASRRGGKRAGDRNRRQHSPRPAPWQMSLSPSQPVQRTGQCPARARLHLTEAGDVSPGPVLLLTMMTMAMEPVRTRERRSRLGKYGSFTPVMGFCSIHGAMAANSGLGRSCRRGNGARGGFSPHSPGMTGVVPPPRASPLGREQALLDSSGQLGIRRRAQTLQSPC